MSDKVDVLAVMDRASARLDWGDIKAMNLSLELAEARAAVAELIEAVKEYRDALQEFANDGEPENYFRHELAEQRLDAALSRIGGGV